MSLDTEIKGALDAHGAALDAAIKKYEGQTAELGKADGEIRAEVKALSDKFEASITEIAQKMEGAKDARKDDMSAGEEFVKSDAFKDLQARRISSARVEVKNTILSTSTGVANVTGVVIPGVVGSPALPMTVRELIPTVTVNGSSIRGVRQNVWTNNAAPVAEGASKPESSLTFSEYNMPIETIAHWLKVSNQLLQDAPAVVSFINSKLREGLAQKVEQQIIAGDGVTPNLSGLTDTGNFTAFTAASGASLTDSIIKAKYQMWATGRQPDTVIVNPADWGAMVGAKGTDGHYLYGAPGFNAAMNPYGLNVVLSIHIPAGFFLVGNLRASATIYQAQGATVEMGFVNDDFTKNLVTIRAEERLALVVEDAGGIVYGDFSAP